MYLWKLSQSWNTNYDSYDSAVVCAESEDKAREIHPSGADYWNSGSWTASPAEVTVVKIGTADSSIEPNTVVCASYNAG